MVRQLALLLFLITIHNPPAFTQYDHNQNVWFTDLQKANQIPDRVYQLDLSDQGLTEIPVDLLAMVNLEHLKLSDNQITNVDTILNKLPKLRFLELSGNNIQQIRIHKWGKLRYSLEELWLRDNRLETINGDLSQLKYLTIFNVGNNPLTEIDSTVRLKNLEQLILDHCLFKAVPSLAVNSPKLTYLNLNANQISSFTLTTNLRQLHHLNIGDNPLRQITVLPGKYKLQKLILDWTDLPNLDFCVFPKTLEILSLEHCNLERLPPCLPRYRKLRELSLIQNNLSTLPKELNQLRQLEKIWISGNPLNSEVLKVIKNKQLEIIQ